MTLISSVLVGPSLIQIEHVVRAAGLYRSKNRMGTAQVRGIIPVKLFRNRFFVFSACPHGDTAANI